MILVTGSHGFIGKHLWNKLNSLKLEFIGYDLVNGQDIRNKFQLAKVFETTPIDTIIHLAAEPGVRIGEEYPDEFITTNILGTEILLNLAEKYGVKHVIAFSSSSIFGEQECPQDEHTPPAPTSLYGITKAAMEMLCHKSRVPITIVRPFSVYGENGRGDQVLNIWLNQIKSGKPVTFFGKGDTKRGYIYVGDLVEGVIKIFLNSPPLGFVEIFNLGGQEIVTLQRYLDIFKSVYPDLDVEYLPLPAADPYENWADIKKARQGLGWDPKTNFEEKIREIISV